METRAQRHDGDKGALDDSTAKREITGKWIVYKYGQVLDSPQPMTG